MAKVFISYRRKDSKHITGWVHEKLARRLGSENIFYDINSIDGGEKFEKVILEWIPNCCVVLLMIGPDFMALDPNTNETRLKTKGDYVFKELSKAIECNKKIIPILIDDTPIPLEDAWPEALQQINATQYFRIRSNKLDENVKRLVRLIKKTCNRDKAGLISTLFKLTQRVTNYIKLVWRNKILKLLISISATLIISITGYSLIQSLLPVKQAFYGRVQGSSEFYQGMTVSVNDSNTQILIDSNGNFIVYLLDFENQTQWTLNFNSNQRNCTYELYNKVSHKNFVPGSVNEIRLSNCRAK